MTPVKPFDSYMWRWGTKTPSQGLLRAPVFLGVLRALGRHEGEAKSGTGLFKELEQLDVDLHTDLNSGPTPLTLATGKGRNKIRNTGQYWQSAGVLVPRHGKIELTTFGRQVVNGKITMTEFAAIVVQQMVLPNPIIYKGDELLSWIDAGLEIRPLRLILEVISKLGQQFSLAAAWLNNDELIRIVIPLAGGKADSTTIVEHIIRYRCGKLDVSTWPDCVLGDNDDRLALEFLLFLANFGLLRLDASHGTRDKQRFYLDEIFDVDAAAVPTGGSIFGSNASAEKAVEEVRHSLLPSIIERQRTMTSVLARPGQAKFRSQVMKAYQGRCFLTGEAIAEVLEAAHIVPVTSGGADHEENGLCMRTDVHRLYDSGNLRIQPDGSLMLSDAVAASASYKGLPTKVTLPAFVKPANIAWRDNYLYL